MLDAVYMDALEEKRIVAIKAQPAFRSLLEVDHQGRKQNRPESYLAMALRLGRFRNPVFLVETGGS